MNRRTDSITEARVGYFWRLDRLCILRNYELRLRLISKLYDSSSAGHIRIASTFGKALDTFWLKRIRHEVKYFCVRCVVCRRANIHPHMAATIYPYFHVPT
jgi:hypothetical protein